MTKKLNILILLSMIFASLTINFLFGDGMGLILTLLHLLALIMTFVSYRQAGKWKQKNLGLLLALILISFTYIFRDQPGLQLLNIVVFYGLLSTYHINMLKEEKLFIDKYLIISLLEQVVMPFGDFPVAYIHIGKGLKVKKIKEVNPKTRQVLIGILIALPILMIFTLLLASADDIFRNFITIDFSFLDFLDDEIIPKVIIWFLCSTYIFSHFYYLLYKEKKVEDKPLIIKEKKDLDIIISTILVLVNSLFMVFVFIQFRYLFSNKILEGMTFSSYARKGFFELVIISMIVIIMTLILSSFSQKKINTGLLTLMTLNTMVIAYSAIFRMNLYIEAYGYTWLRIVSQSFTVLQILIMIVTCVHLWKRINIRLIIAGMYLFAYILLNFVNVDAIIISGNMDRYLNGEEIDVYYYNHMSADAIETLVKYRDEFKDKDDHLGVYYDLDNVIKEKKNYLDKDKLINYNYTRNKAYNILN
ncbi:DUF4173 domain-containing protein [Acidaminobacter sp. JC074]|uniref:DUF4153 domain-containing protein n=1 Tax=Acidaminobacter sp. JC074 TaxID=2530199 RepID=UPI001F0E22F5|nr:DUF4173 domain-containing protein [Acidaminobacter sp. JC074]MCH4890703.1 DUF4173 domain-containing protein [Acidaminobacter sp. JC074]